MTYLFYALACIAAVSAVCLLGWWWGGVLDRREADEHETMHGGEE